MFRKILIFSSLLLTSHLAIAQEEETPWYEEGKNPRAGRIGMQIGIGYYLSGHASADFYSARDNNRLLIYLAQPQIENQIRDAVGGYDFEFANYADNMRYNRQMSFNLGFDYSFKNDWYTAVYFHQVRLTANGVFALRINRQNQQNQLGPYIQQVSIRGEERRSQIQIAVGKRWYQSEQLYYLLEAGFDITVTEAENNQFEIGRVFSLPLSLQNNGVVNNPLGTGFGWMCAAGVGYELPRSYGLLLKATYVNTEIVVPTEGGERSHIFLPALVFTKRF